MARENTQNTQPQNAPDYLAWHVTQKGEKAYWSKTLRKIRIDVMLSLKSNISIYREVARELHRTRIETADQERGCACANVHTAMSLKFAHLCNDFAHLDLLDATPQQADLFDML